MPSKRLGPEIFRDTVMFQRIGTRGVQKALQENRALGIPSAFTRDGKLYFELPDGSITQKNPFKQETSE